MKKILVGISDVFHIFFQCVFFVFTKVKFSIVYFSIKLPAIMTAKITLKIYDINV